MKTATNSIVTTNPREYHFCFYWLHRFSVRAFVGIFLALSFLQYEYSFDLSLLFFDDRARPLTIVEGAGGNNFSSNVVSTNSSSKHHDEDIIYLATGGLSPRTAFDGEYERQQDILSFSGKTENGSGVSYTFPRLVYLNGTAIHIKRRKIKYPLNRSIRDEFSRPNKIGTSSYQTFLPHEREWFSETCDPVENIPVRPTCNSLHELGALDESALSSASTALLDMTGAWRDVWQTKDPVTQETVILKVFHLEREFDVKSFQIQEMDIRVMERLTASPHIISAYGFCGQTLLTQFAPLPAYDPVLKNPAVTWRERLVLARDLAIGLAELHSLQPISTTQWWDQLLQNATRKSLNHSTTVSSFLEESSSSTMAPKIIFAHHDINFANVVSLTSPTRLLWNDFNHGMITKHYHRTSHDGKFCPVPLRIGGDAIWRSPEEIQSIRSGLPPTLSSLHPSDVYSFGTSILYTLLTKEHPQSQMKKKLSASSEAAAKGGRNKTITSTKTTATYSLQEEIARKILQGDWPIFPPQLLEQASPSPPQSSLLLEAQVLFAAIQACSRRSPHDRPTAFRLALSLGIALEWVQSLPNKEEEVVASTETIERIFA